MRDDLASPRRLLELALAGSDVARRLLVLQQSEHALYPVAASERKRPGGDYGCRESEPAYRR